MFFVDEEMKRMKEEEELTESYNKILTKYN